MRTVTVFYGAVACFGFSAALAQAAPERAPMTPEVMRQMMDVTMGAMVPVMGKITEIAIDTQLTVAERPATAARIAAFKRNLFNELVKQGFSSSQAFQIVLSTGIPTASPSAK